MTRVQCRRFDQVQLHQLPTMISNQSIVKLRCYGDLLQPGPFRHYLLATQENLRRVSSLDAALIHPVGPVFLGCDGLRPREGEDGQPTRV